ncbi:MAG: LysE family transporter, partial [Gammaproteobacteria bacterium]|nr:LysE family transporter [Gammaproteobacteria bacterium]
SKGAEDQKLKPANHKSISSKKAFITGFLTNLLNPKATMFFLAVFSQFINVDTAIATQVFYASTCVLMTFLWFSFVAVILSHQKIKLTFLKFTKWIDRICGVLLIGLSVKLLFTTNPN